MKDWETMEWVTVTMCVLSFAVIVLAITASYRQYSREQEYIQQQECKLVLKRKHRSASLLREGLLETRGS